MTEAERKDFELKKNDAINQFKREFCKEDLPPLENSSFNNQHKAKVKPKESFGLDFFELLNLNTKPYDNDRLIILVLILLLSTENGNKWLLLALVYILL